MSRVRLNVRRASYLVNRFVACRQGERTGCVWVCEYPKSGGTWFGKMLADVLGLPYPAPPLFPVTFPAVMHNHWTYDPRLRRCCYLVRDGRDVMVSFFFHRMRRIKRAGVDSSRAHAPTYRRLFGRGYDPDDAIGLLPRFIEREFARPTTNVEDGGSQVARLVEVDERPLRAADLPVGDTRIRGVVDV